ncbi:MAG: hypothetical protein GY880_11565 [Planctomycetaceae bacterium]|nr:hypothetical protein [Planctomycetaceae bacterium]MCP4774868.1 hypothetical protein [Planctomycetaceae bacterium]
MRRLICAALLFTIAAALGCDGEQLSKKEKEAQAAQNEKVKTALENQGRQPLSKPPELEKSAAELTETDSAETPLVATEVLGAALKSAKAENKAVLVHFTADW